ncbi:hypothetical protein BD779DRAFT_1469605 [Infundibulicybe gibba]|nr:hypothetical protein BD779DRAFT_1469605 [Infundibulicybe gibba]
MGSTSRKVNPFTVGIVAQVEKRLSRRYIGGVACGEGSEMNGHRGFPVAGAVKDLEASSGVSRLVHLAERQTVTVGEEIARDTFQAVQSMAMIGDRYKRGQITQRERKALGPRKIAIAGGFFSFAYLLALATAVAAQTIIED